MNPYNIDKVHPAKIEHIFDNKNEIYVKLIEEDL